jgi:hypothetical protein
MAARGDHGQYRSLAINGDRGARGQGASCEGEGTGQRRAGAAAGRTLAWCDVGGVMRARVDGQQRGNGGSCAEWATARAGSRQHRGEKERGSLRQKKSLGKS